MKRKLGVQGWRKHRFEVREKKCVRSMCRVAGVVRVRFGLFERNMSDGFDRNVLNRLRYVKRGLETD